MVMSDKKKQYYVVIKGRNPGLYAKWFGEGEAAEQILGYPEAVYKGFFTRDEAVNWLRGFSSDALTPNLKTLLEESEDNSAQIDPIAELVKAGKIVIFTDGSAMNNPGPGGYGVVLKYNRHRKELSGGFRLTTNNRMEIYACIAGLRALKQPSDVVIVSDSKYVVESMNQGWARRWQSNGWRRNDKEKTENADLWAELLTLCDRHTVDFYWIKGHNSTKENERCDQLALAAAQGVNLPVDAGFEEKERQKPKGLFDI
jgi:ribonuclease HI